MKTQEEINELERDWTRDPIWDLETTTGFEEHVRELEIYALEWKIKWGHEYLKTLIKHADQFDPVSRAFEMAEIQNGIRKDEDRYFEISKRLTMPFYA